MIRVAKEYTLIVNIITGAIIVTVDLNKETGNLFMYLLAGWMFLCALYVIVNKVRRSKGEQTFDRSMRGELNHAISMATHQVHLSQFGRWNLVPVVLLILLSFWEAGKSMWVMFGLLLFAIIVYYATGWEYNIYETMERELKKLRNKL